MERLFEQVDKRFEQVDKRLEQVEKRFEEVDKRFSVMTRVLITTSSISTSIIAGLVGFLAVHQ